MLKNLTPKQKIVIIVIAILLVATIIFFVVRSKRKKKKFAEEAEKKIGTTTVKTEPTPAEGGEFRVIPKEDEQKKEEANFEKPQQPQSQQQPRPRPQQVVQKPHVNNSGNSKGGALPPIHQDVDFNEESSFNGKLFNVDDVMKLSKKK